MANTINYSDKVYKEFGVKTGENTSEFFEIGADARNVFIQNGQGNGYGDVDGVVDLQTKLNNFNRSIRNIGSGIASNKCATAFGYNTSAGGEASHAEGHQTQALGDYSHAEGYSTIAQGNASHAEGTNTIAYAPSSHAEGDGSHAEGFASHAEGYQTTAQGKFSHAEGYQTIAKGFASHAEGYNTLAEGTYSHAEGENTQVLGKNSHVEGFNNISLESAYNSHVEGSSNRLISGSDCHIEGRGHQDWEIKSDNLVFYTMSNSSIYLDYDKIGAVEILLEAEKIDERIYNYQYSYNSSSSLNLPENSQGEDDIKYYRGYLWVGRNLTEYQQNNIILKQKFVNNQYYNVLLCIEPIPGDFSAAFLKNLFFNEKGTIISQAISGVISDAAHVQGRYSLLEEGFSHIVGGGTSLNDRRNIHTLDWDGNAEFAGDVTLFGCGGSNPIQLSSLTKGPLVIQESMIDAYSGQGSYGDKILDAIQKNRQILILLTNQGDSPYSLYSPVITYHLPYEANTELSLFYLPDGISPTNFTIKEAQFMVSNPITFNDNLKN